MSYILDALKKSEQQRGHGTIPDVQTIHSSSLNYHQNNRTYWPYILITAVLLNLAAIVYFIVNSDDSSAKKDITVKSEPPVIRQLISPDQDAAETPVAVKPAAKNSAKNVDRVTKVPTGNSVVHETRNNIETEKHIEKDHLPAGIEAAGPDEIIEFYELPESIRRQLPAIIVSAHVYSSNPNQRSIVINNNFMEEGEYVLDDLILDEITADGAIFEYHGTRFRYEVVSGWQ